MNLFNNSLGLVSVCPSNMPFRYFRKNCIPKEVLRKCETLEETKKKMVFSSTTNGEENLWIPYIVPRTLFLDQLFELKTLLSDYKLTIDEIIKKHNKKLKKSDPEVVQYLNYIEKLVPIGWNTELAFYNDWDNLVYWKMLIHFYNTYSSLDRNTATNISHKLYTFKHAVESYRLCSKCLSSRYILSMFCGTCDILICQKCKSDAERKLKTNLSKTPYNDSGYIDGDVFKCPNCESYSDFAITIFRLLTD